MDPSEWMYGAAQPKELLGDVTTDHQGLLTAYFAWAGPGLAPDHASFLVLTHLGASAGLSYGHSGQTGGLSATARARTETFGEQVGASGDGETNPAPLNGRHLLRVSANGGVAKVEVQGEVKTTTSNSLSFSWWSGGGPQFGGTSYYPALGDRNGPTDASASASLSATASYDGREATISCPSVDTNVNGGSQYREPALTGPIIINVRQSDGTLRGDTLRPYVQLIGGAQDMLVGFHANVAGNWGGNSLYLWNNQYGGPVNPGDNTDSGTFTLGVNDVPDHDATYRASLWGLGGASNLVDHIYLHLTDSRDGIDGTANYYLHVHEQYEPISWPEDSGYPRKQTTQIDPDVPSWPTYSWHTEVNPDSGIPDSVVGPIGATTTFPYTGTEMQSWHLDGGLGIPTEPVDLHFGGGYDKDITNKTSGTSTALPVPLLRGQKTWAVYREDIRRHRGHLDIYSTHGYASTGIWYRDETTSIEHSIYYPYADATTDNVHDPDPNWNPGG